MAGYEAKKKALILKHRVLGAKVSASFTGV
jgi:hypothetical protein